MAPKVKSVVSAVSDAVETACGWALLAAGLYAAIFVDVTGGGSLWTALRGLSGHAAAPVDSPAAVRRTVVPAHGVETAPPDDQRMLAVFSEPDRKDGMVEATVAAPEAYHKRPEAAYTDSPADPNAGKNWKKSLRGDLRKFTTYGQGEQASVSAAASAPQQQAAAPVPAAIVAASGSAARAGAAAAARPGVGSRLSSGSGAQSDSVRNIR